MTKDKSRIDYATRTITRQGSRTHLAHFVEMLDDTRVSDTINHTIALGWNFYHRMRPAIPRNPVVKPMFITFHGFRIYLDERVPPNMAELRDKTGHAVHKFFWSE